MRILTLSAAAMGLVLAAGCTPAPPPEPSTFSVNVNGSLTTVNAWSPGGMVTLQVNGDAASEETLDVINGSFSFTTALNDGDAYDVTLSTALDTDCTLSGASSGTIAGADVTVDVSCESICPINNGEDLGVALGLVLTNMAGAVAAGTSNFVACNLSETSIAIYQQDTISGALRTITLDGNTVPNLVGATDSLDTNVPGVSPWTVDPDEGFSCSQVIITNSPCTPAP